MVLWHSVIMSFVAVLFAANLAHAEEYFIYSDISQNDEAFAVIKITFSEDKAKVLQVTYLEDEISTQNMAILQGSLKVQFLMRAIGNADLMADVDDLLLVNSLQREGISLYLRKISLTKSQGNNGDCLLKVSTVSQGGYPFQEIENTVTFYLQRRNDYQLF